MIPRIQSILEISTKSRISEGVRASAFNLRMALPDGRESTIECAYQGSKSLSNGGPYTDLYAATSLEAKRDTRLRALDSQLLGFNFFGEKWPITPKTVFYDWLYLRALSQPRNSDLARFLCRYDGFTDIEFNPKHSISCQAASAALFVALERAGRLGGALSGREHFLSLYPSATQSHDDRQGKLI